MGIIRITVRTFQNEEHAAMFLQIGKTVPDMLKAAGHKCRCKMALSQRNKTEVLSIWEYDDEVHMKAVRKTLSELSKLPNSLMPKEIAYQADIVHEIYIDS